VSLKPTVTALILACALAVVPRAARAEDVQSIIAELAGDYREKAAANVRLAQLPAQQNQDKQLAGMYNATLDVLNGQKAAFEAAHQAIEGPLKARRDAIVEQWNGSSCVSHPLTPPERAACEPQLAAAQAKVAPIDAQRTMERQAYEARTRPLNAKIAAQASAIAAVEQRRQAAATEEAALRRRLPLIEAHIGALKRRLAAACVLARTGEAAHLCASVPFDGADPNLPPLRAGH
jgi:hypothetical protein